MDNNQELKAIKYDRQHTKAIILEHAGQVFAEYGYAMATSKEICQRAGVNLASVNYYFGSKEKLYEEVLIEAHKCIISTDTLIAFFKNTNTPKEKLKNFLEYILKMASNTQGHWSFKIIFNESTHPTTLGSHAIELAIIPKKEILLAFIHEISGLALDSEEIQSALLLIVSLCAGMLNFSNLIQKMNFSSQIYNKERYIEDLLGFILGGLEGLKKL